MVKVWSLQPGSLRTWPIQTDFSQVVDLGCGECTLLKQLKFHREIELLVGVDINGAKLKKKMYVYEGKVHLDKVRSETYQVHN